MTRPYKGRDDGRSFGLGGLAVSMLHGVVAGTGAGMCDDDL